MGLLEEDLRAGRLAQYQEAGRDTAEEGGIAIMPIQSGTFKPLPSEEELLQAIELEKAHNADLISYLLYIMPIAERFGERVYDTAAE